MARDASYVIVRTFTIGAVAAYTDIVALEAWLGSAPLYLSPNFVMVVEAAVTILAGMAMAKFIPRQASPRYRISAALRVTGMLIFVGILLRLTGERVTAAVALGVAAGWVNVAMLYERSKSSFFLAIGVSVGVASAVAAEILLHDEALWIGLGATLCIIVALQTKRESETILELLSEGTFERPPAGRGS